MIDDPHVDALRIVWDDDSLGGPGPRVVDAPPERRLLRDFLSRETWQQFVQFILPGALNHHGRVAEYSGFRFPSDLDPDDEPFEGVELFDPIDTLHLSEAAFDRLMSRYFDVIVQGVTENQRPELREPWWPRFVQGAQELSARAQNGSASVVHIHARPHGGKEP